VRGQRTPDAAASRASHDVDVYGPREDTFLLTPFARVAPGTLVLEVGTGAGSVALAAARHGGRVVVTDLNRRALSQLRATAVREGLEIAPVRTDLARGLGRFDRVLANPPYLPTPEDARERDVGTRLALDGGPDGCRVLARFVSDLSNHLTREGVAFVVVSNVQDPGALARIRDGWVGGGGRIEVAAERALEGERLAVWQLSRGTTDGPATD